MTDTPNQSKPHHDAIRAYTAAADAYSAAEVLTRTVQIMQHVVGDRWSENEAVVDAAERAYFASEDAGVAADAAWEAANAVEPCTNDAMIAAVLIAWGRATAAAAAAERATARLI